MPSWDLFENPTRKHRNRVLPLGVSGESRSSGPPLWVGTLRRNNGRVIGIATFGFKPDHVVLVVKELLSRV